MKHLRLLLVVALLMIGAGCAESDSEGEVAYCTDREGRVVEEERCERDSPHYDPVMTMLYFHYMANASRPAYVVGQAVPVQSAMRAPSGTRNVYRASEVVKPPAGAKPLRLTPAPPKPAGWSVRTTPASRPPSAAKPATTTTQRPSAASPSRAAPPRTTPPAARPPAPRSK